MSDKAKMIALMSQLRELGCRISVDGEKLRIRTTKNILPSELTATIKANKSEIIEFLNFAKEPGKTLSEAIPHLPENTSKTLSFAQQRLWILGQLEGPSPTYNIPIPLQLEGYLNVEALFQSLTYIVNRHSSLRMCFPAVKGQPQVRILGIEELNILSQQDLQHLDQETQSVTVQKIIDAHGIEPFNLLTGPLFKAELLQLQANKFVLLINMHHIISDGWSMGIFMRELHHAYSAFSQGQQPSLPLLPIQYTDFAAWQRDRLQGEFLETQVNYWKNQLKDVPPLCNLQTDYPRPSRQSYQGDYYIHSLSIELTEKVKALSQQEEASLFMVLLAAFSLLLSRYSRQYDLCIGSPIANRTHSQIEGLIGFFINTLVLRSKINPEESFIQLLQQTRQTCLDAYSHQDIPFECIVECLHPERSLSYNPLFQVLLVLQNIKGVEQGFSLPDLNIQPLQQSYSFAKFDLLLDISEKHDQLRCGWVCAKDLFEQKMIQRMAGHFEVLLQEIVNNPQQPLKNLPWLTEAEQRLLISWNQTQKDYPQNKTLLDLFEETVKQFPHHTALVFGEQSLTYQELNQKVNQIAHYLHQNYSIKSDTLVGICIERSLEMIVGLLAILKAGGAYVPIDPTYPEERIKFILENSGISLLLSQSFIKIQLLLCQLSNHCQVINLDQVNFKSFSVQNLSIPIRATNLAYIVYTCGTTGHSKGVMIEHRGLVNLVQAQIQTLDIHSSDRILQFADASLCEILMAFGTGATLYLDSKDSLMPGKPLIQRLKDYKITHITLPLSVLNVLPFDELPNLKKIIIAGEMVSAEIAKRWCKERVLINTYGFTELAICATIGQCEVNKKNPFIVKPIANHRIYILDEDQQVMPPEIAGELCIAGVGLARGYLNRPDLTAEKFIQVNIFGRTERIYRTGDLAKWNDDGNLEFLGRIDNQVKLRGFHIDPGEIETLLLEHPAVNEALVTLYETESNQQLVAYVTGEAITDLSTQLKRYLKSHLPDYKLPTKIIQIDQFTLSANGKIDPQALPIPNEQFRSVYEAPRNDIEQRLSELWSLALGCSEISIYDNFFDLGGYSLLAIKLLSDIQESFNLELALSSLFQNPTIAQLAPELSYLMSQSSLPDY
ncbi:MAG: amino acid adenylation domain-containing protein [Nostoc desertorum CM1-VF14]|jgi:amino acid adenylation domain-containing protein|nr:amino acid adenylation domain-containing protein [Nostoc desertorum CM1-VF14]